MFRRYLFLAPAFLALLCLMVSPDRVHARHGRGGVRSWPHSGFDGRGFGGRQFGSPRPDTMWGVGNVGSL
jgi:hypothetical protein